VRQLEQRHHAITAKLDRGYEDYVSGRISEEFWTRKSQAWETELQDVSVERARCDQPWRSLTATGLQILELAKQAELLYQMQPPAEQRRLLDTVLSNCTFDRGTLCPTYSKPFDLLVRGNETGDWRARQDSNLRPPA
jgi:site-specific DNA recombinase